jgi:hypothetical protein
VGDVDRPRHVRIMTRLAVALMWIVLVAGRVEAEPWDAKTVVAQSAAGTVVLAGGTVLFFANLPLCGFKSEDEPSNHDDCPRFRALAIGIGTIAATIASVQLVGYAMDGTGSLVGGSLGFGVGFGFGVGVAYGVSRITDRFLPVAAAVLLPMVAGSVISYHLSADPKTGAAVRVPLMSLSF